MTENSKPSIIERVLRAIPIIGYAAKCVEEERVGELFALVGVLLLAAALSILIWGYAALITIALTMVVLVGTVVIGITRG
ncbi:MAG: hypothetical protein HOP09_18960 [Hyphomicrobium sp.]|nr:hypothetical protein [Hyphomicrobium sp.]NOT73271.1 hypothetical protein [Hyphomicrobium sp.]